MASSVSARHHNNSLYLVDSSIYIFKAWHMQPATCDADGNPANAAVGFAEFLFQLIKRRQPSLLVCAFDESHGQSLRHAIYPAYKANRPPPPAELKHQFSLCKSFASAAGAATLASPHVEADDIIGTLSQAARNTTNPSVIVSADKDLCQFVGPDDAIWDYTRDTWMDQRLIEKRFGVRPDQLADLLALTGDKTDNIPGVPGVGVATAAKLLIKWGNLDLLLDNIANVGSMKFRGAGYIARQLADHAGTVRLARRLTGLQQYTPPASVSFEMTPDFEKLELMFDCLQFDLHKRQQWWQLLG